MNFEQPIIYNTSELLSLFGQGAVSGVLFGSIFFVIGYVVNFLLSLFGGRS